ncbi:MAG: primosomal protein N', partial [Gemmatimonadales bacterium]
LINVIISSTDREAVAREAESAARWVEGAIEARSDLELVGPAPSPIERLHGRWRWHFLLRSGDPRVLGDVAWRFAGGFRAKGGDVRVVVDRDPTALL